MNDKNANTKKIVKLNAESLNIRKKPVQAASTAMPEIDSIEDRFAALSRANAPLELETNQVTKRGESYYKEAMSAEGKQLDDVINPPAHAKRLLANLVDYSLVVGILFAINHFVAEKMNLSSYFSNSRQMNIVLFFFIVSLVCFLPALFLQNTLGKKLFKIKIRGRKYYNANPFQLFLREVILKPISILMLFGIYLFFTEKESMGPHSTWSATTLTQDN